ncbi:phage protein [Spartinivicinus ruber]|uniref:phage protein n=1 Tax=Spartinivicinus ruber TaxID=2683272 RepID=UPI0013D22AA3|nr:phage protein [Spartinivicinus ruber]
MHISGKSFDIHIGDFMVHVNKATLDITDNRSPTYTRGVPDGYVDGDVSASGEVELDSVNFQLVLDAAKQQGSFKGLEPFDMVYFAKSGDNELKVEVFGCLFKISSLLDIDSKGGEKSSIKLPYEVTDSDFVRINGVPYLRPEETEHIVQSDS